MATQKDIASRHDSIHERRRCAIYQDPDSDDSSSDTDDHMVNASGISDNDFEVSHPMGPPPQPMQRRSAPSPEPLRASLPNDSRNQARNTSYPWLATRDEPKQAQESSDHDEDSGATVKPAPARQDSLMRDMSPMLAAFEERAGIPGSLSAYNRDHGNPCYIDLEEPRLSAPLQARLDAMRARNAEENHHYRIPPEDAPPHMQMMVLLYQWAAWALEISDERKRGRMLKWVNGRTLDFMMSGGRIPGYNLKELLEIAGVDPKELYGVSNAPVQHESRMGNMSSTQLAAAISGEHATQAPAGSTEMENPNRAVHNGLGSDVSDDHQELSLSSIKKRTSIQDDGEVEDDDDVIVTDDIAPQSAATYCPNALSNRDGPFSTAPSAMVYEGPADLSGDRKRGAASDDEKIGQVCRFFL
jgi:hypothetical protein